MRNKGFTLVELMVTIAILAILAVVAVPSLIKYMRRAKTVEAIEETDKILKGAVVYYTSPLVTMEGQKMACRFPSTQAPTPAEATCCATLGGPDADEDDRCDTDPEVWQTATWKALSFEMRDAHYFIYSFVSMGEGDDAAFDATANADLDCDQELSTFQRRAWGMVSANGECGLRTTPHFFINDEVE